MAEKHRNRWAEGKSERSEQASKAANARWQKHREQCSAMQNDAHACSSDADLCSSNAAACSSMLEQCSAMLSDAIVTSNQLSVNSKDNINTIVQSESAEPAKECSADAEPSCASSPESKKQKRQVARSKRAFRRAMGFGTAKRRQSQGQRCSQTEASRRERGRNETLCGAL